MELEALRRRDHEAEGPLPWVAPVRAEVAKVVAPADLIVVVGGGEVEAVGLRRAANEVAAPAGTVVVLEESEKVGVAAKAELSATAEQVADRRVVMVVAGLNAVEGGFGVADHPRTDRVEM